VQQIEASEVWAVGNGTLQWQTVMSERGDC